MNFYSFFSQIVFALFFIAAANAANSSSDNCRDALVDKTAHHSDQSTAVADSAALASLTHHEVYNHIAKLLTEIAQPADQLQKLINFSEDTFVVHQKLENYVESLDFRTATVITPTLWTRLFKSSEIVVIFDDKAVLLYDDSTHKWYLSPVLYFNSSSSPYVIRLEVIGMHGRAYATPARYNPTETTKYEFIAIEGPSY